MEVRALAESDVASLRQFALMASFSPSRLAAATPAALDQKIEKWLGGWNDELGVGVDEEGQLIAAAWARRTDIALMHSLTGEPLPEVVISVVAQRRDQHLGTQLMDSLERLAVERDFPGLCLRVSEQNPRARRVDEKAGFLVQPERTDTGLLMMSWEVPPQPC
jgi:GNAT superfamily N-acetyltransferase